jgi:hypothetical protein
MALIFLPSIMLFRPLICVANCVLKQPNYGFGPVEAPTNMGPWTMEEFGNVEIPETIEIEKMIGSLKKQKTIKLENILLGDQYTVEQKKSVVVRVRQGIAKGLTDGEGYAFLKVMQYLGRHNNPSELTSFILSYTESIKIGMCKTYYNSFGYKVFYDNGYCEAVKFLPSAQDKFMLTQKVMECIKAQILLGRGSAVLVFMLKINDADLRNQVIFDILDTIPERKRLTDHENVRFFGDYVRGQISKTKFVFGLTRITNLHIARGLKFSRLDYLLGMLGSQHEKVRFFLGLKKGMLNASTEGYFQHMVVAMLSINIVVLPERRDIASKMQNVDIRSFGVKGPVKSHYENNDITLLKFFIAIEVNIKAAMSTGNVSGLAIILGYSPSHLKTIVLERLENQIKEAVYTGNAVDLIMIAPHLPGDLKAIILAPYVDDVRAAALTGDFYPLRAALESIDGYTLQGAYIQQFENIEIGANDDILESFSKSADSLRSLKKKLETKITSLDEAETGTIEIKKLDVIVESHGPFAFTILRANLYNCQSRLSNLILKIDPEPVSGPPAEVIG